MSVTSACTNFVNGLEFDAIPGAAVKWGKWGILDCTGVALAGAATQMAAIIEEYLAFVGGKSQARVLGLGVATSAPEAAMAGGALSHALDFDDVGGFGHSTAVLLPVIYAFADLVRPSGKEALAAYVAGYEIGACLADTGAFGRSEVEGRHFRWHPTALYGAIAAACTAARLLRMDREKTRHAIGIAASEASGIPKNYGTMTKPLHAGLAARNGVFAALLAQRGFTADLDALDGDLGFLHAFRGPGNYAQEFVGARLGSTYALSRGLVIKPQPAPWSTQRATSAVAELVRQHGLRPDSIESIEADLRPNPLLRLNPSTGLEGKFSMAFNLALGVLKGRSEITDYTAERAQEQGIRSIMQRIRHVNDPADGSVNVAILTRDGKRYDKNVKRAPGDPFFGLQEESTLAKFRACAAYALPADLITAVEADLRNLEQVADLSKLLDALTAASKETRSRVPV